MSRLLIVSNRLPVSVRVVDGAVTVERSSGGLATGMSGPHERMGGYWIGWPGRLEALPPQERADAERRLAELRLVSVPLTPDEVARYYESYSNAVLWPLFHYFPTRLPFEVGDFDAYEQVNERFAEAVAAQYQLDDLIWVHDYHLMLVPQMVRDRIPDARIGFFLHIPFPSSETFRLLPQRERLVEGILGADLVGFHTAAYLRHFASSVLRLTSAPIDVDKIRWRHGEVRLGVFPMGIDAQRFSNLAQSAEVTALVQSHRFEGSQLLVGVDRLDYTKGIPRRLIAFDKMLRCHPELCGKVRLVQVAVPSR
jgi:trehalose 6-phosphate synthase/phosphatase